MVTGLFEKFIRRNGLPKISFHSLRHTNITLLIAAGNPIPTVSKRAGHANSATTISIYAHAIRTLDEKAAEVLENILQPNRKKYQDRKYVYNLTNGTKRVKLSLSSKKVGYMEH